MPEQDVESKEHGHGKLDAFLDAGSFDGVFTNQPHASAIEKFVERGDKVEDLLLRGHFRDADHMNALVRLLRKATHFHDSELRDLLLNHAAGYPAIGGLRIDILLRAVVGQLAERQRSMGNRLKNALGLNQKDGKNIE